MSKRHQKLAPRVRIARAATADKAAGWREEVPAFVVRHGMAIHPIVRPGLGPLDVIAYRLSATGCGYSIAVFETIEAAEKGLMRVRKVVNWSRATAALAASKSKTIVRLLTPLGATR